MSALSQETSSASQVDLLVIGGGINGMGIAADAAGRGLSVLVCEKADLGAATSSASTKLVHGGLRYLEHWQFRLVRESLQEREVLLGAAPHIIWPMRFILPHHRGLRPAWMIRAGLFLYDRLGGRISLPRSSAIRMGSKSPLRPEFNKGFAYSDCWVDDARLVILNARQVRDRGGVVMSRTRCVELTERHDDGHAGRWLARLRNEQTGQEIAVSARCVVNAAGPWVGDVAALGGGAMARQRIRLVKGSHIVVPKLYPGDEAYLLQNSDGRVVFAIPYEHEFTLIGTTDENYQGDPAEVKISAEETDYLCAVVTEYFRNPVKPGDVVHSYAGVRPLQDDEHKSASEVTRDYELRLQLEPAPLLTVIGGKITTYRRLAEAAMAKLHTIFPEQGAAWTHNAPLPGGDFQNAEVLLAEFVRDFPFVDSKLLQSWVRRYGTLTRDMLAGVGNVADLGDFVGPDLCEREIDFLIAQEWAVTAEDILWRRSKLGLHWTASQRAALENYLERRASVG